MYDSEKETNNNFNDQFNETQRPAPKEEHRIQPTEKISWRNYHLSWDQKKEKLTR